MAYGTRILADSVSPAGKRITTFELTYPRFVHAELLTHRLFSKNSASSRAIPVRKMLDRVCADPAMPLWWGKNQPGMQANEELDPQTIAQCRMVWLDTRNQMVTAAEKLLELGLHKQVANRLTEPWMFITVILTATEFDNWERLRDSPMAQPEIAWVARDMKRARAESEPLRLQYGDWHVPLVDDEDVAAAWDMARERCGGDGQQDFVDEMLCKVSVGRCARVSYLTHDGVRDMAEDVALADRLMKSGHWSPFEHVAAALPDPDTRVGNFLGWRQYRADVDPDFVTITCPRCDHEW